MGSPRITFLFFFVVNFLIAQSSSPNFLACLTEQFQFTNSPNDVIYTPQSSSYTDLLHAQNLRPQSTSPRIPDFIIIPYHESEIQAAIYCSKKHGIQIRVRSGGHDYEGLSYTSKLPFVIVDMRNFRLIQVHTDEKTAWVQVGATLGQLYHAIAKRSRTLAFPAGTCPTVGVGGHFSGGGYGMLSRKHGLAADHIIDARLINADGEILDRITMGEDLFWAIRGGGAASFGIVIEFKVTLVTVPETVTVFDVTRTLEQNVTQLVHRWQHIADQIDENILIRPFLSSVRSPETGNRTISAAFSTLYLGSTRDLLPLMSEQFPEIGLVEQDCVEMSWIESVLYFAGVQNQSLDILLEKYSAGPSYYKGKSDIVATPMPVEGLRGIWKFLHEEDEFYSHLQLSPYGGALNNFSEFETPFPHRSGNRFMIHYLVSWIDLNDSKMHMDWITRLYGYMATYATKSPRSAYYNYRDLDIGMNNDEGNTTYEQASVWGLKYFKNNYKRLVRAKTNADPFNIFRNEQSIPPMTISAQERIAWL